MLYGKNLISVACTEVGDYYNDILKKTCLYKV